MERLVVMNGQRVLQTEQAGQWHTTKVDKAGEVKPGIYQIHNAIPADQSKQYSGQIIHSDKNTVYQQVGKSIVKHPAEKFAKPPIVGVTVSISFENGQAVQGDAIAKSKQHTL